MGEFKSGILALGLFIYLGMLISGIFLVDSFASEYGLDGLSHNSSLAQLSDPANFGACGLPRTILNPASGSYEDVNVFSQDDTSCEYTIGNADEAVCNQISGCSWENNTFLWFTTGSEGCVGDVNLTDQGITAQTTNIYGDLADLYKYPPNQTVCTLFGFTWSDDSNGIDANSFEAVTGIIGDFFTLRVDFATNTFLNIILNFILFYVPFIAFLIAIYFAIPVIH